MSLAADGLSFFGFRKVNDILSYQSYNYFTGEFFNVKTINPTTANRTLGQLVNAFFS